MSAAGYYTTRGHFRLHIREVIQTGTRPDTEAPIYRSFALCGGIQSLGNYWWVPGDVTAELKAAIDRLEHLPEPCEKCLKKARKEARKHE